ncbi:MAG: LysM peptidoglycan-binding domain-containing protein [Myxococcales bacterium]|nr:LysM peptidoglycan-binding domain-containing protein [Myxococcales bacterium]
MGLAKLQITPVDGKKSGQSIDALFNPKEYTISKSVPWNPQSASGLDAPELQFTTGQGQTLQLELFFDTYEAGTNVKAHTDKLHGLALIDTSLHRPPMVLVTWGSLVFKGVVESLNHRFTMFMEDGTPVRATCSVTLREAENASEQATNNRGNESPDHAKLHAVRRGETLQSIAGQEYDDPNQWRRIADANGIDDPFRLDPGVRLIIPPILR